MRSVNVKYRPSHFSKAQTVRILDILFLTRDERLFKTHNTHPLIEWVTSNDFYAEYGQTKHIVWCSNFKKVSPRQRLLSNWLRKPRFTTQRWNKLLSLTRGRRRKKRGGGLSVQAKRNNHWTWGNLLKKSTISRIKYSVDPIYEPVIKYRWKGFQLKNLARPSHWCDNSDQSQQRTIHCFRITEASDQLGVKTEKHS